MVQYGTYTLEELGLDIRSVLDAHDENIESVLRLGRLLQRFGEESDVGGLWKVGDPAKISSGLPGRRLYDDPDQRFRLLLAQYAPHMATAVHSHEGWVVLNILSGSERYTSWRRVDDGADPRKAQLELAQDHHILKGEIGYLFNEPLNVHRQAAESEGAVELVLMKGRGQRLQHIDADTGECSQPMELGR